MKILLGIDDTDNLESRGTGWRARELGRTLEAAGIARLLMVTRHQLLVHADIPYTSHNSSASLLVEAGQIGTVIEFAREFLLADSAEGSDAGLCVAPYDQVGPDVILWGNRAKREVLTKADAETLAAKSGIHLEGLTGTRIGVIGSLAAVGLRREGNDGRILWCPGLRELSGITTPEELMKRNNIQRVLTTDGASVSLQSRIELGEWVRPVMKDNFSTLFVEEHPDGNKRYRIAEKNFIKRISE
jgi:hypothetical protein